MRKGIEFIGKVEKAWIPSSVFGSDTRSVGCADGGSTVGAVIIGGSCAAIIIIIVTALKENPEKSVARAG